MNQCVDNYGLSTWESIQALAKILPAESPRHKRKATRHTKRGGSAKPLVRACILRKLDHLEISTPLHEMPLSIQISFLNTTLQKFFRLILVKMVLWLLQQIWQRPLTFPVHRRRVLSVSQTLSGQSLFYDHRCASSLNLPSYEWGKAVQSLFQLRFSRARLHLITA